MKSIVNITTIDELKALEGPVLVDFWAPWCNPCKRMEPVIEATAQSFAGKITVVKVNIEAHPTLAEEHGVMSIPTFSLFNDGEEVARRVGSMSVDDMAAMISDLLLDLSKT